MYNGRITEVGEVIAAANGRLVIHAPKACGQLVAGRSVNIDGVCLSAEHAAGEDIVACISDETISRSTLGELVAGRAVNIEMPLKAGDPIDGHLVQGHVDAIGKVARVDDEGAGRRVWIRPPTRFLDDLVAKGSVAVDGVSLTVAEIGRDRFSVALVPATLDGTTLAQLGPGRRVNLESDVMSKLARAHGHEASV